MRKLLSLSLSLALCSTIFQSCDSLQSTSENTPLTIVQQIMNSVSNEGFNVLGNAQTFATNALVDAALPDELKSINSKLESLGLSSIVAKEKEYIGQAATKATIIATPIVKQAIQQMTIQDAVNIIAGGSGAATKYLKEKTQTQLISAIQPEVEKELNKNGATQLINSAFSGGNNLLGSLTSMFTGGSSSSSSTSSSLSGYASQQMVNGLFSVMEDYENKQRSNPSNLLGSLLGTN